MPLTSMHASVYANVCTRRYQMYFPGEARAWGGTSDDGCCCSGNEEMMVREMSRGCGALGEAVAAEAGLWASAGEAAAVL